MRSDLLISDHYLSFYFLKMAQNNEGVSIHLNKINSNFA